MLKPNSPHFAEDISFINKSNTYCENESSSILETLSAIEKKPPKISNFNLSNDETTDRTKSMISKDEGTAKKNSVFDKSQETVKKNSVFERNKEDVTRKVTLRNNVNEETPIKEEIQEKAKKSIYKQPILEENIIQAKKSLKTDKVPLLEEVKPKKSIKGEEKTEENIINSAKKSIKTEKTPIKEEIQVKMEGLNASLDRKSIKLETPNKEEIQAKKSIKLETPKKEEIEPKTEKSSLIEEIQPQQSLKEEKTPLKEEKIEETMTTAESNKSLKSEIITPFKEELIQAKKSIKDSLKEKTPFKDETSKLLEKTSQIQENVKPQTTPQVKVMDKARQRKEEFEKRIKEQQTNENKLQSLKQKFQTNPLKETKDPIIKEDSKKPPLTPKEENIPEHKAPDFDAIDIELKRKLAEIQGKEEKNVISLKDFRNNFKKMQTETAIDNNNDKYIINSRGQKINKKLCGIIGDLEQKLAGTFGGGEKENKDENNGNDLLRMSMPLEHITMERSKIAGHKKIKSKNTDFFDLI